MGERMIDTDKYEGHTEGPWRIVCWERHWYIEGDYEEGQEKCTASTVCDLGGTAQRKDPTARLIADAPLLLEAYKRLRKALLLIADTANGRPFVNDNIGLSFVHEVFKELIE